MFYPKPTQVVKRMRKAGEGRGRPQAASAQPKPAGSARRNRPPDGLACGPAFPAVPCVSRGLRHSGIFASRSRFFRSFQSGITSATTAWNAGEWFACTRCASSCTIM